MEPRPDAGTWQIRTGRGSNLLVQLGPYHVRDDVRFQYFLDLVPRRCGGGGVFVTPAGSGVLRDERGESPMTILRATAPFVYIRLHGPDNSFRYSGLFSDADLRGGRPASTSGTRSANTCMPTSTTTVTVTLCAIPSDCAPGSAGERRVGHVQPRTAIRSGGA